MTSVVDTEWVELENASSWELNLQIRENTNAVLAIKESAMRSAYNSFTINNQTLTALFFLCVFISVYTATFLQVIIQDYADTPHYSTNNYSNWIVSVCYLTILNLVSWGAYLLFRATMKKCSGLLPFQSRRSLQRVQMILYFALLLFVCYRHIMRSINDQCALDQNVNNNWNCNPVGKSKGISGDTSIMLMLIPVMYSISVRGAHFEFSLLLWLMTVGTLLFSIIFPKATNGILFATYYVIGSFCALMEARRNNLFLFFTHCKLQDFLHEKEKAVDAANAEEMRHMIGNVAHDLKTPLSSFVSGIEYISSALQELEDQCAKAPTASVSNLRDWTLNVKECIMNMNSTNSFMLMTINRSIDYTKASKGVKLVPKFETIDLLETLSMPLKCMKDIQTRTSVTLRPLDVSICSHVITDKQWLQENLLCLLSNAVKYSSEGAVDVCVERVSLDTHLAMLVERAKVTSGTSSAIVHKNASVVGAESENRTAEVKQGEHRTYLRIEVEDHGIGLSQEAMVTLFNPFKQAQRLAGGTGLGLFSLAKRIEALDGICGVQRRRDSAEGSLFWFQIPYRPDLVMARNSHEVEQLTKFVPKGTHGSFATVSASNLRQDLTRTGNGNSSAGALGPEVVMMRSSSQKTAQQKVTESSTVTPPAQSLDVLVVDDAPAIIKMTSLMLRRHKHTVSTATNGAEAVKAIAERVRSQGRGYDAVLMDLQMPIMDGLEATRRIRAMEESGQWSLALSDGNDADKDMVRDATDLGLRAGVHNLLIGVSANSDTETTKEAFAVGVDYFIAKPFTMDTFYRIYDMSHHR